MAAREDVASRGESFAEEQIVCPWCGHVDRDSSEWGDGGEGDGVTECGECERVFEVSRHLSVTYSTRRPR